MQLTPEQEQILDERIEDQVNLSDKTKSSLQGAGIRTIRTLVGCSKEYLVHVPNLTDENIEEIVDFIESHGLSLYVM